MGTHLVEKLRLFLGRKQLGELDVLVAARLFFGVSPYIRTLLNTKNTLVSTGILPLYPPVLMEILFPLENLRRMEFL